MLIIGSNPFISQSSPAQTTAQNWFFILWNLGTRHLFSYLWFLCLLITLKILYFLSLKATIPGSHQKLNQPNQIFGKTTRTSKNKHLLNFHKHRDIFSFAAAVIFYDKSCQIPSSNCKENDERKHRGRKGIFNFFSKFSKLIFDLSGLIDQNESENSNVLP